MIKKITFLCFAVLCSVCSVFGQTEINDFETGAPATVVRYGTTFSVVANPNTTGNTTTNCGRIGRTTSLWYELIAFDLAVPYNVPAGEKRYLHVLVNYPAQPDLGVRFDATDSSNDGSVVVRSSNDYTNFGEWQDMVFEVDGGASGLTVNAILMHGDIGFQNDPVGLVLNNTSLFGYVDEFTFSSSSTPTLSNTKFEFENSISVFPNPVKSTFQIKTDNNTKIANISFYDLLGKTIVKSANEISRNTYDISNMSSGLYMVRITDDKGNSVTKRLMKQ
ncbi:putative secreted protein (Por secretion system target) [Jejuia pallidilutea]|uniref:Putative secreted protein (Por secretion system target) n=1 Tax=Jejuia pallidilutea TaxID=504487 RepID=A0A362WZC8_9FLAO|nr:T9SS type A sorting domain-containing protein [Jejuia pallidilutea]PQV48225.1 putative secreted protein (Por secretion system target) [Jejuia pallidilutea]